MREQDGLSAAGVSQNAIEPGKLILCDVVVAVSRVESDNVPEIVLKSKVARGLVGIRECLPEISHPPGIHFVIAVQEAANCALYRGPEFEESVMNLVVITGVVDIPEV